MEEGSVPDAYARPLQSPGKYFDAEEPEILALQLFGKDVTLWVMGALWFVSALTSLQIIIAEPSTGCIALLKD